MMLIALFLLVVSGEETGDLIGMTNQHNYYRCQHGAPLLKWSEDLEQTAREWALIRQQDNCLDAPSSTSHGENRLWSQSVPRAGPTTVDVWYANNPGPQSFGAGSRISDQYGEFNQVVWRATTQIGCAVVICPSVQAELVVCQYEAPGNVGLDSDAVANIKPYDHLPAECQTIADGWDAGLFVSPETDETNPAAIAIGAGVGALSLVLICLLLFLKREAWFKWTSAKFANQQPFIMTIVMICLQITVFALLIRSQQSGVPWVWIWRDGSWMNPTQVCMARTGSPCTPFTLSQICANEYACNGVGAAATAQVFIILAAVACWITLVAEACLAFPRIPLEPRLGASMAIFGVLLQISFVWLTLWFYGGYLISYFSGRGFPIADEGVIVVLVCLPLFLPLIVIASAQMTLHTK